MRLGIRDALDALRLARVNGRCHARYAPHRPTKRLQRPLPRLRGRDRGGGTHEDCCGLANITEICACMPPPQPSPASGGGSAPRPRRVQRTARRMMPRHTAPSCPGRVQRARLRERNEIRDPARKTRSAISQTMRHLVWPLGPGSSLLARSAGTQNRIANSYPPIDRPRRPRPSRAAAGQPPQLQLQLRGRRLVIDPRPRAVVVLEEADLIHLVTPD